MARLRILLVPDFLSWVLGTWAKQIALLGERHDYFFFSQEMLPYYPNQWNELLATVDVVHFLNQWEVKNIVTPADLPTITTITHTTDEQEWDEQLAPLTRADAIVVMASEWREFLHAKGVAPDRVHLFNNGVDTARFHPFQHRAAARRRLGIRSDAHVIGYSAKFSSNTRGRKGIDTFLEAARIAAAACNVAVLITGPGWETAVRQLRRLGVEVHYRPFVPDRLMPLVYNAMDTYVVTSLVEGGPAPLLESMACGTPVVTTPVGMGRDYVEHGVNGMVVPKGDASACAHALLCLRDSPELRGRLVAAALRTVEERLTWAKTQAGIEDFYERVWQAKEGKRESLRAAPGIDPALQRRWAINVDVHLWHRYLFRQGHRREGLRGMLESSRTARGKERFALLYQTISAVDPSAGLRSLRRRARSALGI